MEYCSHYMILRNDDSCWVMLVRHERVNHGMSASLLMFWLEENGTKACLNDESFQSEICCRSFCTPAILHQKVTDHWTEKKMIYFCLKPDFFTVRCHSNFPLFCDEFYLRFRMIIAVNSSAYACAVCTFWSPQLEVEKNDKMKSTKKSRNYDRLIAINKSWDC